MYITRLILLEGHSKSRADDKQCVFQMDITKGELALTELAPGVIVDEIKVKTDAKSKVADNVQPME